MALCTLNETTHLSASVTLLLSGVRRQLELKSFLMRRELLLPKLALLIALGAEKSLSHGDETSGGEAPGSFPSQRLSKDNLVGDISKFVHEGV